jgi:hypothetical protein
VVPGSRVVEPSAPPVGPAVAAPVVVEVPGAPSAARASSSLSCRSRAAAEQALPLHLRQPHRLAQLGGCVARLLDRALGIGHLAGRLEEVGLQLVEQRLLLGRQHRPQRTHLALQLVELGGEGHLLRPQGGTLLLERLDARLLLAGLAADVEPAAVRARARRGLHDALQPGDLAVLLADLPVDVGGVGDDLAQIAFELIQARIAARPLRGGQPQGGDALDRLVVDGTRLRTGLVEPLGRTLEPEVERRQLLLVLALDGNEGLGPVQRLAVQLGDVGAGRQCAEHGIGRRLGVEEIVQRVGRCRPRRHEEKRESQGAGQRRRDGSNGAVPIGNAPEHRTPPFCLSSPADPGEYFVSSWTVLRPTLG